MRVSEYYLDNKNIKHPERIAILDKMSGWMTVDSRSLDRTDAYEKQVKKLNNR